MRSSPRTGRRFSIRNVKVGDTLTGTFVTKLPPTTTSQRSAVAHATPGEEPAPAPAPVAVAAAPHLPKTASPLPLLGLLSALSAGTALVLRRFRAGR